MKLVKRNEVVAVADDITFDPSVNGWLVNGEVIANHEGMVLVPSNLVTAVEYKMLFTPQERIAIKTSTDPVVQDLYELLNDPRVTHVDLALASIQSALDYMTGLGLLAAGRKDEILTGVVT